MRGRGDSLVSWILYETLLWSAGKKVRKLKELRSPGGGGGGRGKTRNKEREEGEGDCAVFLAAAREERGAGHQVLSLHYLQ